MQLTPCYYTTEDVAGPKTLHRRKWWGRLPRVLWTSVADLNTTDSWKSLWSSSFFQVEKKCDSQGSTLYMFAFSTMFTSKPTRSQLVGSHRFVSLASFTLVSTRIDLPRLAMTRLRSTGFSITIKHSCDSSSDATDQPMGGMQSDDITFLVPVQIAWNPGWEGTI